MELKIRDDVVGFGDEQSKRGRTVNSNYFARFVTQPRLGGGADITIETKHGLRFEDGSTSITLRARKDTGPRIGERVMLRGRLRKVADKYYDQAGKLWIVDEDTREHLCWEE